MLISDRIFQLIKEKGMTQKEFSLKTNIPQSTVSDWKGKGLNPSSDKLLIICSVLGTTPNDLLTEASEGTVEPDFIRPNKNNEEAVLVEAFRRMDEHSKEQIIKYAKELSGNKD